MKHASLAILFVLAASLTIFSLLKKDMPQEKVDNTVVAPSPTPKEEPFKSYTAPTIEKKREYTIVMIGDSMTYALGPHGGPFYEKLNALFKDSNHGILVDNYSLGATNILSLDTAMTSKTTFAEWTFEPLLSRQFDLILVESFAYNPLSQFGMEDGIKRQNEELDKLMTILIKTHPKSAVMFVATIAPNRTYFSSPVEPNKSQQHRDELVNERIMYLKNHIEYAKSHNIPVINIFEKSLTPAGDGNLEYINPDDYIHPSAVGVNFISEELANYIYDSKIFPK